MQNQDKRLATICFLSLIIYSFVSDKLNGLLVLQQNISVKRKENVFATGVPIFLYANLTDNIHLINASYSWHVDNSSTEAVTVKPHYEFKFDKVGWQYLGVTTNGTCVLDTLLTKKAVKKTGLWKEFIWLAGKKIYTIFYSMYVQSRVIYKMVPYTVLILTVLCQCNTVVNIGGYFMRRVNCVYMCLANDLRQKSYAFKHS